MLYRRGRIWWFKFTFNGRVVRESTKSTSKDVARRVELQRRRAQEEGYHGLRRRDAPSTLKRAAERWLEEREVTWAPKTTRIERTNIGHLLRSFGSVLLQDLTAEDIALYQRHRLQQGASPKTINLEVGSVRAILRRHRLWAEIQPDVRMLPTRDDHGRALSPEDEAQLLDECHSSRSKALFPAVVLALNTGLRRHEIVALRWQDVDLHAERLRVTKSKTSAGTGRVVSLNERALGVLRSIADRFPDRREEHFVFAAERYGLSGDTGADHSYAVDPSRPIRNLKEAWESAKRRARVVCRFHDLRHTAVTRMLEGGVPLVVVGAIMGWSPSTTTRMAKRYGHIGNAAQREAVDLLARRGGVLPLAGGGHRTGHTTTDGNPPSTANLLKKNGSPHWTISATG
jgi:integrase